MTWVQFFLLMAAIHGAKVLGHGYSVAIQAACVVVAAYLLIKGEK